MPRTRTGPYTRKRRKKWIREAKGYWGRRKNLYKTARVAVMRSWLSAYRDRKLRKRDFRRLWITRLSAALKPLGISYSRFINRLKKLRVGINRKLLSEMAINHPEEFSSLVKKVVG
jgi:large subunit ribosomal protein L20|uniref:Large ribosomal subunit protein bL20 n=1 Tax=candidate division WOR-3 bacterium TaxID=2052148 RepID=A0A7C3UQR4_UNCW3